MRARTATHTILSQQDTGRGHTQLCGKRRQYGSSRGKGGGVGTDIGREGCAVKHMHNHPGWLRGQDVVNPYSMHALTDLSPRVWGLRVCSHVDDYDDYEGRQAGRRDVVPRTVAPHRCRLA